MERKVYDISEVCSMFNITSRTLRFYEQKGIIDSIRSDSSNRRQFTEKQIDKVRNILILRKLGISVNKIKELQQKTTNLKSVLQEKRTEIGALIDTKFKEIALLNQALVQIENEENISVQGVDFPLHIDNPTIKEIVSECNNAILHGIPESLYKHLSNTMQEYMPPSVFAKMREDTIAPLGNFLYIDTLEADKTYLNILYQHICYEKSGLKIRYVFIDNKIHGLWLGYYEPDRRK